MVILTHSFAAPTKLAPHPRVERGGHWAALSARRSARGYGRGLAGTAQVVCAVLDRAQMVYFVDFTNNE